MVIVLGAVLGSYMRSDIHTLLSLHTILFLQLFPWVSLFPELVNVTQQFSDDS